jgi:chromosome segregation ATPase
MLTDKEIKEIKERCEKEYQNTSQYIEYQQKTQNTIPKLLADREKREEELGHWVDISLASNTAVIKLKQQLAEEQSEVKKLESDIDLLHKNYSKTIGEDTKTIKNLRMQLREAREVIEFYGKIDDWKGTWDDRLPKASGLRGGYAKAQDYLEKYPKEREECANISLAESRDCGCGVKIAEALRKRGNK